MQWLVWLIGITGCILIVLSGVNAQVLLPTVIETSALENKLQDHLPPAELLAAPAPLCEVRIREHPNSPILQRDSHLSVGNKGEEIIELTNFSDCNSNCWRFDRAEIEIQRRRFGGVQFVSLPQSDCIDCAPIKVRWYHEPTGFLSFAIRLYQRQLPEDQEQCPQPMENKQ